MNVGRVLVARAASASMCPARSSAPARPASWATRAQSRAASTATSALRRPGSHRRAARMRNVLIRPVITTASVPRATRAMPSCDATMLMSAPPTCAAPTATASTQWAVIDANVDRASAAMPLSPRVARVSLLLGKVTLAGGEASINYLLTACD